MEIIQISSENMEQEHICCALGSTPDAIACSGAKKKWMGEMFGQGYQFHRLDQRGKALIETIPGENVWAPIEAAGWLFIDCFWVSGKLAGHGYAGQLFQLAVSRAKKEGRHGLVALSSSKKSPFLSDPGFYRHKGFETVDTAPPHYLLLALPFHKDAPAPHILPQAKTAAVDAPGLVVYHSDHCPHPSKYVPLLEDVCREMGVPFTHHKITSRAEGRAAPNPFPTFAMFYQGKLLGNEIFSPGKLMEFLEKSPVTT